MARDVKPEVYTSERCYIAEVLNAPGCPEVSIARARVAGGITTRLHSVTVLECYVIESGHGRMHIGDAAPFEVGPGSFVRIPPGAPQKIENTCNEDLIFSCVCAPRWTPDCYTELE